MKRKIILKKLIRRDADGARMKHKIMLK